MNVPFKESLHIYVNMKLYPNISFGFYLAQQFSPTKFGVVFLFIGTTFIKFDIFIKLFSFWTHFIGETDRIFVNQFEDPCLFS